MPQSRAADFAKVARELHEKEGVEATLETICAQARDALECDECGVMLVHGGRRVEAATFTDHLARRADELQMECGEGPCLQAMDAHAVYIVRDTTVDERWPAWCRAVADTGIRSVLSVRLYTQRGTVGCLNLYGRRTNAFTEEDGRIGVIFGGHASVALAAAQTEAGLREGMEGRHLIGLAQGMLMERFDIDLDTSFSVLRRYSQDRNMKLRAVARHVVDHRSLPD